MRTEEDYPCLHLNFTAHVEVTRITANEEDPVPISYSASITVACSDCGEPFRWTGVQARLNAGRPMCNVGETELRAPLRPASADPDFGLGIPGFAVTWRQGNT